MTKDSNGSTGSDTERDDWRQYESPTAAVVATVATVTGRPESTLPPLYEVVDPEAIDRLISSGGDGTRVAFSYAGTDVVVDADGTISVERE